MYRPVVQIIQLPIATSMIGMALWTIALLTNITGGSTVRVKHDHLKHRQPSVQQNYLFIFGANSKTFAMSPNNVNYNQRGLVLD